MLLLCVLHKSGLAIGRATVNFSFAQQMVLPLFQSLLTSLAGGQNGTLGRVGSPSLLFVAVVVVVELGGEEVSSTQTPFKPKTFSG